MKYNCSSVTVKNCVLQVFVQYTIKIYKYSKSKILIQIQENALCDHKNQTFR
jgi:hypothetical protein